MKLRITVGELQSALSKFPTDSILSPEVSEWGENVLYISDQRGIYRGTIELTK